MSKKLIAGAGVVASFAIALAPLATFATGQNTDRTVIDNLEITIEDSCAFGHDFTDSNITDLDGSVRTNGTGEWETSAGDGTTASAFATGTSEDTAAATMEAGTKAINFAKNALTVFCNNATGYQVKLTATNLASDDDASHPIVPAATATIADFNVATATQSIYNITPTKTTSSSSFAYGAGFTDQTEATGLTTTANTLFFKNTGATDNSGDKVEVQYGVGLMKTQGAGTYTGSVTYVLSVGQGA